MKREYEEKIGEVSVAYRDTIFGSTPCLTVASFHYQENCSNDEHEEIEMARYNSKLEKFRRLMFLAGWWWASRLPYEHHPDGGLVVKWFLPLDEETLFESPWNPHENGCDQSPEYREVFCPAVAIDAFNPYESPAPTKSVNSSFCYDHCLVWHWDLD